MANKRRAVPNDGAIIDKNSLSISIMQDLRNPPTPWEPQPFNRRVIIVEGGVQAKNTAYQFIVLNREADRISELKRGRLALTPRQLGFARLDDCLVYLDNAGEFHYLYGNASGGNGDKPTLVTAEWDIGFLYDNPAPERPGQGDTSISIVMLRWNLVNPAKQNVDEPLEILTPDGAEMVEDVWNLG